MMPAMLSLKNVLLRVGRTGKICMSTLNEIQATTDFSTVLPLSSKSTHNAVFPPIFDATLFVMLKVVNNLEQSKKVL